MATLEVHDGPGRVQRVTIARDQTVLFGSSPKCDIVLDDPGVLPFHGRIRWKRDRFKVDASPEAEFVEVNGRKMATSSFRQGDEIRVGSCRIFLINADDRAARPTPTAEPVAGHPPRHDRPAPTRMPDRPPIVVQPPGRVPRRSRRAGRLAPRTWRPRAADLEPETATTSRIGRSQSRRRPAAATASTSDKQRPRHRRRLRAGLGGADPRLPKAQDRPPARSGSSPRRWSSAWSSRWWSSCC